jgi:hypothetical protein
LRSVVVSSLKATRAADAGDMATLEGLVGEVADFAAAIA